VKTISKFPTCTEKNIRFEWKLLEHDTAIACYTDSSIATGRIGQEGGSTQKDTLTLQIEGWVLG
jgi:hypothetical protein